MVSAARPRSNPNLPDDCCRYGDRLNPLATGVDLKGELVSWSATGKGLVASGCREVLAYEVKQDVVQS